MTVSPEPSPLSRRSRAYWLASMSWYSSTLTSGQRARNPAASCLSTFKLYSVKGRLRITELGATYRNYVELMAHFDRVLPGKVHRVIYENMVADPEREVRRLLEYLGLPFEAQCLRFYETKRTVLTPSSEQVRRPITSDAVDYWRHFEPFLGPLMKTLGPVLTDYPEVPEELR